MGKNCCSWTAKSISMCNYNIYRILLPPLGGVSKLSLRNTLNIHEKTLSLSFIIETILESRSCERKYSKVGMREKILELEWTESRNRKNSMNE